MKKLLVILLALPMVGCFGLVEDPSLERGGEFIGEGGKVTGSGGATGGNSVIDTGGASGGNLGSGGAIATGGMTGSGGDPASSGGAFGSGGSATGGGSTFGGSGGAVTAAGGRPATGGAPGTGGASTAVVCTSKVTWTGGTGSQMRPGAPCKSCHGFSIAGTIYPTLHEPVNCNGVSGSTGVRVVITGANGATLTLTPSGAGNFYSNTNVTLPYTAKITSGGLTRSMVGSRTTGDCNSCHSQNGANMAPGRIMAPSP